MNRESLQQLIHDLYEKKIEPQEAYERLKNLPYEDLGFAQVDHHRSLRNGIPEVIYCEGKTPDQILTLIRKMDQAETDILATRLAPDVHQKIQSDLPSQAHYNPEGRTLILQRKPQQKKIGHILVLTAGTSDIPIAEEAVATAGLLGSRVETVYDVGVAGIHRLLDKMDRLREARVIIVVAGMDGALVSVVGGLVECPVIAVPTRVGYGASFEGLAALLTMLNSCAPGVSVVNIENGFGAGCLAHRINLLGEPEAT
ncbi:MAG: nickel pincer cofactor biosynthesis protein LarB [Nitrospinaceae bacterium]|jgi:NCAIR mutase (PurE)-related protein